MEKKKNKINLKVQIGNFLIYFALLILGYIYLPVLGIYLNPPKIKANLPTKGYFITIPKISAQAPILENINPFDQNEYRKALEKGIAEAKLNLSQSSKFLFAHSSDSPFRVTRYNTIFLRLSELEEGDEITLTKDGVETKYKVFDKKEVWPKEISYLKNIPNDNIILQTCTPIGTSFKRLLIFAKKG